MEDLKEIKADVKEVKNHLRDVSITLARNTASLEIHVKRTDLNEARIAKVENWILGALGAILLAILGYYFR